MVDRSSRTISRGAQVSDSHDSLGRTDMTSLDTLPCRLSQTLLLHSHLVPHLSQTVPTDRTNACIEKLGEGVRIRSTFTREEFVRTVMTPARGTNISVRTVRTKPVLIPKPMSQQSAKWSSLCAFRSLPGQSYKYGSDSQDMSNTVRTCQDK